MVYGNIWFFLSWFSFSIFKDTFILSSHHVVRSITRNTSSRIFNYSALTQSRAGSACGAIFYWNITYLHKHVYILDVLLNEFSETECACLTTTSTKKEGIASISEPSWCHPGYYSLAQGWQLSTSKTVAWFCLSLSFYYNEIILYFLCCV